MHTKTPSAYTVRTGYPRCMQELACVHQNFDVNILNEHALAQLRCQESHDQWQSLSNTFAWFLQHAELNF